MMQPTQSNNNKYRKLVVHTLSSNFRAATRIEEVDLPASPSQLPKGHLLAKVLYTGVNASDINFTAGKYLPGAKPPFDAGFEAVGVVEMVGEGVPSLFKAGTPVSFSNFGCYREYMVVKAKGCVPIPSAKPEFLPLLVSATTASLALECVGDMKSGETVLVTAAAGGTGQFAVQLAKLAGNHVIGTCSTPEKVEFLKSLGCDRVINYKTENVFEVLKQEYPKGIDLVYESIGGTMFDTCVNNLAIKGRLIIIGMISGYQDGTAWEAKGDKSRTPLAAKLLAKSASVRGFFLNHYWDKYPQHLQQLARLVSEGKLISHVDASRPFVGIESVADAVDYMYSGKNVGKVVVAMHPDVPHPAHKKAHL